MDVDEQGYEVSLEIRRGLLRDGVDVMCNLKRSGSNNDYVVNTFVDLPEETKELFWSLVGVGTLHTEETGQQFFLGLAKEYAEKRGGNDLRENHRTAFVAAVLRQGEGVSSGQTREQRRDVVRGKAEVGVRKWASMEKEAIDGFVEELLALPSRGPSYPEEVDQEQELLDLTDQVGALFIELLSQLDETWEWPADEISSGMFRRSAQEPSEDQKRHFEVGFAIGVIRQLKQKVEQATSWGEADEDHLRRIKLPFTRWEYLSLVEKELLDSLRYLSRLCNATFPDADSGSMPPAWGVSLPDLRGLVIPDSLLDLEDRQALGDQITQNLRGNQVWADLMADLRLSSAGSPPLGATEDSGDDGQVAPAEEPKRWMERFKVVGEELGQLLSTIIGVFVGFFLLLMVVGVVGGLLFVPGHVRANENGYVTVYRGVGSGVEVEVTDIRVADLPQGYQWAVERGLFKAWPAEGWEKEVIDELRQAIPASETYGHVPLVHELGESGDDRGEQESATEPAVESPRR